MKHFPMIVVMALAGCESAAEEAARYQPRVEAAKRWCEDHALKGAVSCGPPSLCDVVPSDGRAPFALRCYEDTPCRLLTPGEKPW